jgi:arginine decarboxylase
VPEELQHLDKNLSAIYYCNFSLFQSAPDIWAIDHLFPIMPIHRLDEEPTVAATLADLTCDSDGMIDHFIDVEDVKSTLAVHTLKEGEHYYLGMYLFGDTNAVHVELTDTGYQIGHVIKGDSVSEVLRYVEYQPENMIEAVRRQAERAVSQGRITNEQMRTLMQHYEESLRSYTYLTDD